MHAHRLWSLWQALALAVALGFTQRGRQRFVEWVTGLALNVEAHTITQSLVGLDRVADGKALENFAEYGSWNLQLLPWGTAWAVDRLPANRWHGYHVWAGDDTKVQRTSPDVWGTSTFHEYTARCPHRASTVRTHNWVGLGALVPRADEPALLLPVAGRLYFRQTQLTATGETFRTECELRVDLLQQQAAGLPEPHLAVFDGGFALGSVVRPLVQPSAPEQPVIAFVTRLRHDAHLPPTERRPGQHGPTPQWGQLVPSPRPGGRWPGAWQVVEVFCARFRQGDIFRDLKQRLGWEECRAWTKNPIERTTQARFVTLTLLRLLQLQLPAEVGDDGWLHPPWNPHKTRPSVWDVERLLRQERVGMPQCLAAWLEEGKNSEEEGVVPMAM